MERVFNFSAGPSVLPESVLEEAANELVNYQSSGMSVMEMSHRSSDFVNIFNETKQDLIDLMDIPDQYEVLFLQGGASTQFAMIPMNLMGKHKKIQLVDTGAWSTKAMKEAKRFGQVDVLASSKDKTYNYLPDIDENLITKDNDYFYITSNNTIYGTCYKSLPDTKGVPIVADMSSNILSEPVKVSDYGIIFAGAQKNMGPAGVTVVIIRKDLIGLVDDLPTMLDYQTHVAKNSMFNTPPTYSIYMAGKVYKWLKKQGGLEVIKDKNEKKAALIYDYLDQSELFKGTVVKKDRSMMNIPFVSTREELDKKFIAEAEKAGLVNLKGHRTVGGMRASVYNAMPMAGVEKLVEFMAAFEKANA